MQNVCFCYGAIFIDYKKGKALRCIEHSETHRILHLLFLKANVIAWYGPEDGKVINSSEKE
jgi:hypothetical protein